MKMFIIEAPHVQSEWQRSENFPDPYTEVVADSILRANPNMGYRKVAIEEPQKFIIEYYCGRGWERSSNYTDIYSSPVADNIAASSPDYRKVPLRRFVVEIVTNGGWTRSLAYNLEYTEKQADELLATEHAGVYRKREI
jgi:hypothetical protein